MNSMPKTDELMEEYKKKRNEISKRIGEFKEIINQPEERVFAELAFCICTPQSRATICWKAISSLTKDRLLLEGDVEKIRPFLNVVRFGDKKATYIIEARDSFTENGELRIKEKIESFRDVPELREWLVENIKGLGYKEASHFLRNIGLGKDLAILDVHILKNLKELKIIEKEPKSLTKRNYLDIENKMKNFSKEINIPMEELDLLLWSRETGIIFK